MMDPTSEAYAVWRGSLVDEMVEHGYSLVRAEQVIDDLVRRHRR